MNQEMEIKQYLHDKSIEYIEHGKELATNCVFHGCDDDSRPNEHHLHINSETGQYHCKKCGESGNLVTLKKHFGDWPDKKTSPGRQHRHNNLPAPKEAVRCHKALPQKVRDYLITERGLTAAVIDEAMIGYGVFYGRHWITIPIFGIDNVEFLKLRSLPWDTENPDKYKTYPSHSAELYNGHSLLVSKSEEVVICEGELDAVMARRHSLPLAVSSTAGAETFKEDWLAYFKHVRTVWLCFDNDEAGERGAHKLAALLGAHRPDISIMQIKLPPEVGEHGDLTTFLNLPGAKPNYLFSQYAKHVGGEPPVDPSEFTEMGIDELADILSQTIKFDYENKVIVFLGMLTAYTEEDQLNLFLTGPSSSGKTYIATEVAKYYPAEDVEEFAAASPTAFRHRRPIIDPDTGLAYVDCERKILIFMELPHPKLQENLRPLLSHDKKEVRYLVTEKEKSGANTAKDSVIRGYSATVFCSTAMRMDEQEATRSILLSPDVNEEKLIEGIDLTARKNADPVKYEAALRNDPKRRMLERRIRAIKKLHIDSVIVPDYTTVLRRFKKITGRPKPRHQRDVAHMMSLVKALALLNAWHRFDGDRRIIANERDVDEALRLWQKVSESQELGVPPYANHFYKSFIVPAYQEKNAGNPIGAIPVGVTRREISTKHYELTGQMPNEDNLRKNVLPTLLAAGLIYQERDPSDAKQWLIYPKQPPKQNEGGEPNNEKR